MESANYLLCSTFKAKNCSHKEIATSEACLRVIEFDSKITYENAKFLCEEKDLHIANVENDYSFPYAAHRLFEPIGGASYKLFIDHKIENNEFKWPSGNAFPKNFESHKLPCFNYESHEFTFDSCLSETLSSVVCGPEQKPTSSEGDPHIQHYFSNLQSYLCYDVTGLANQKVFLIHDFNSNVQVYGVFRDDYYFGQILLNSPFANFSFNSNDEWISNKQINLSNEIRIKFKSRKSVEVDLTGKGNRMKLEIKKGINSLNVNHLDLNLLKTTNKKNYGGLFGFVENTEFEIFEQVQNSNFGTMKKLGKVFSVEKKYRKGNNCWLMSFNDVIYPYQRQHFIS